MEQGMADNLISLEIRKQITSLYKSFLETIEDIKNEHRIMKEKVSKHCAQEFAEDIDYFTDERHNQHRKKILDTGNEAIRQIIAHTEMFDFHLNEEKVKQAAQRKVVKKFTTSSILEVR